MRQKFRKQLHLMSRRFEITTLCILLAYTDKENKIYRQLQKLAFCYVSQPCAKLHYFQFLTITKKLVTSSYLNIISRMDLKRIRMHQQDKQETNHPRV